MILIFLILLISSSESVSKNDCDLSSNFINKIQKSDLVIVGRILNNANNDIVVSVIRILKGFELINEVKKISRNNDYHLIVVRNIKYIKNCNIEAKSGEDFLFYLNKTNEHNFFQLKYVIEFGDGSFEKRISAFINGGTSKLIQSNDPCSKLNCRYGAQCQKWPGNPPTAVCHCSTTQCSSGLREHQVCGNDGVLYETACHMKKQECIFQKSIKSVSLHMCESSLAQNNYGKTDVQQDEISQLKSQFCQNQNCPPYATCVNNPYPHCKCPTDNCSLNDPQICGTDEITYTNICELKKVSCKANRLIEKQYEGRCDMCKFIKCDFNGICEMTEDGTGTRCKCPNAEEVCLNTHLVAVCGSDDITYKSECHMKIEACRRKALITVIHKGDCQIKIQKDICSQQLCRYGAKCQTNLKKSIFEAKCSCDHIDCGQTLNHNVCGDDGKTYKNQCLLNKAMCEKQISISVLYEGPCDQNPCLGVKCSGPHQYCKVDVNGKGRCVCPEESCPKVVQPVCGNDNVTYDSICHLTRTACITEKLLWVLHNGVCSEEPRCQEQGYDCLTYQVCRSDVKQTKCECPTCPDSGIGEYVCGSDENTYRSECHLRSHACITKSVELKVANIGSCDACQHKKCLFYSVCRKFRFEDPQCICPTDCVYERRPVCGSDDRTYENECFLKVKSCAENKLITVFSEGPCKKCPENCSLGWMCKRGKCVCADRCPKLKLRVCGTDGNYYDNECELKRKACIDNKTIKIDMSDASCTSRQYISDETGPNNNKNIDNSLNGKPCFCNKIGSINIECDTPTPHCTCKTGVTGQFCNKCSDGYWNFSESGCIACSCNKFGSESIQCNVETGKCVCKPLAMGKYCSVCPTGYSMSNDGCKENSENENKIDSAELGFMIDSFVKSSWSGNAENYLYINISFVPYNSEGVIFYHSDPDRSSDFLSIILKNKYVEYRIDLGSGILLLKSATQIDLGKSHSILVERLNRYSRLVVDNTDSHFGMSPSFLSNLDAGVQFFLGKAPQLEANKLSHTSYITDSFFGCLSSLKIIAGEETNYYLMNQQTSWIAESSNVKLNCPHIDFKHNINVIEDIGKENIKEKDYCENHKPCLNGGICKTVSEEIYNCHCLPGYQGYNCEDMVSHIWKFKDSSFVIVPSESLQLRQRIKLEISFLPTLGNGLLAFISDGHDRNPAFISVLLYNNHVEVRCRTPIGVTRLTSLEFVKISKWNQVVVLKAAKYIYLNLNQSPQPIKKRLIPKGFMNVESYVLRKLSQFRITNQPIFFGGVDNNIYASFSNVVSLKPHFQGAIQKILVNGENIRFQSSDIILNNITQWQGAPCGPLYNPCSKIDPEKSYCIAEMNKSMCFCNPKQEHLCIRNSMQHDNPANTVFNRKFSGQSCAKFTAAKQKRVKSTTKNNIRIKFKTESKDGLLLLMKNNYSTKMHFFAIVLRNSVIEVAINLGGNNGIIRITSNRNVSDNKWHAIQVIRNNRNVVLLVDNRMFRARMLKDHFHNALETDGWMWLGGLRKPVNGFPWEYNTNFQGCIAELYIDEVAFNLINDARKNIGPVLKC